MHLKPVSLSYLFCVLAPLLLASCASKPSISLAVVDAVTLAQARQDGAALQGKSVRWGGMITEVENKADFTWIFVVGRDLRDDQRPITDSDSDGRFVARFSGFIDPLVYKAGRPLTVVGRLDGSLQRAIGEFEYRYPIVVVRDSHLWAEPVKLQPYYPPPPWWYQHYYYHPYPHRGPTW